MMMARLRTLLFPDRMAEDTDTLLTAMDRADNPRPAKRSRPTDCVRSRQQRRCGHTSIQRTVHVCVCGVCRRCSRPPSMLCSKHEA